MSEKLKSGNFSFDTYVTKQEGLLVEYLRKTLQAETKIVLLESALQEMYKNVEELNQQIEVQQTTIDQSIVGLQAVTIERDNLQARIKDAESAFNRTKDDYLNKIKHLEDALNACNNENGNVKRQASTQDNRVLVLENEIRHLNNSIQIANNDYSTLRENYNRVIAALEESQQKIQDLETKAQLVQEQTVVATPLTKKKRSNKEKTQGTDSEWIDGEY